MTGGRVSSPAARRKRAVESFTCAADAIGPVFAGMSLFSVTRGQWSMIDAILHVLDSVAGPCDVTLWTWTVAEYEVQCLTRLRVDGRVRSGLLVIDAGARHKNAAIISDWQATFGASSVRYVVNHAKIATVRSADGLCLLLRGSMNLNMNPRFEQFDITEGGADFDLVAGLESELPVLADACSGGEARAATKVNAAFSVDTLDIFDGLKRWAK